MIRKFTFVVLLGFLFVENSSAMEVVSDDIQVDSYYIQVGAFGSRSNVNRVKEKLNAFDIYIEPYKDLNRVIVVNIMTKEQLKHSFLEIKKFYPKAFITKRPIKVKKTTKNIETYNQLSEPYLKKREIIQQYNNLLDSNTILKTRKSFL